MKKHGGQRTINTGSSGSRIQRFSDQELRDAVTSLEKGGIERNRPTRRNSYSLIEDWKQPGTSDMNKLEQLRNDLGVKLVGMDQSLGTPLSYNPLTLRNPTTGDIIPGKETVVTGAPPMPGPNMRLDATGNLISYPPGVAPPLPPFSGTYGGSKARLSRRTGKKNSSPSRMSRRTRRSRRSTRKAGRKSRRSTRRSRK